MKIIRFLVICGISMQISLAVAGVSNFSTTVGMETSSEKFDENRKYLSSSIGLIHFYKFNRAQSLQTIFGVGYIHGSDGGASLQDTTVIFTHQFKDPWKETRYFLGSAVVLPTSEESRNHHSLHARVIVSPSMDYSFYRFIPGLTMRFGTDVGKNFYTYETKREGEHNISYFVRGSIALQYSFLKRASFSIKYTNNNSWSFEGTRSPNTYNLEYRLWVEIHKQFNLSAGASLGGTTYNDTGKEFDMELYNRDNTTFFAQFEYRF